MILTTHAVIGGTAATLVTGNPVVGFGVGVATHWLSDMIPHWEYAISCELSELEATGLAFTKQTVRDILKIGLDATLGFLLVLVGLVVIEGEGVTTSFLFSSALWGAVGAVVPDGLQFLYYGMRWRWLAPVQRIHDWFHAKDEISHPALGLSQQIFLVATVFVLWAAVCQLGVCLV